MAQKKLTKRMIDTLPDGSEKGTWYADTELRGLYLVTYSTGKRVFFARFRVAGRRSLVRVGLYGELTVEQARTKATEILAKATLGGDPAGDLQKAREMPTFKKWKEDYIARVELTKKSVREDRRFLGIAVDRWGDRPLDSIEPREVEALRTSFSETPTQANRLIASVRACFSAAIRGGIIKFNPASGTRNYRENPPRARVLDDAEMQRLLRAVADEPDPHARAAIQMLVETGARLSEVLHAKWTDIDFKGGTWRIPSPKAGFPQTIPIAESTLTMLKSLERASSYIVAGRATETPKPDDEDGEASKIEDKPRRDLKGPWLRLVTAAKLKDLHVHDVRRTFGLHVARAAGLHVASKLLRHADVRVTERVYAPLGIEDLRKAVEHRAEVLPFKAKTSAA